MGGRGQCAGGELSLVLKPAGNVWQCYGGRGGGGGLGVPQSSTTNAFLALPTPTLLRISNNSRILRYLDLIRS